MNWTRVPADQVELRDAILRPLQDRYLGQSGASFYASVPSVIGAHFPTSFEDEDRRLWNALPASFFQFFCTLPGSCVQVFAHNLPIDELQNLGGLCIGLEGDHLGMIHPLALDAHVEVSGKKVAVSATTGLPHRGDYEVTLHPKEPVEFALAIRLPSWASDTEVDIPDHYGEMEYEDDFILLRRVWTAGDSVKVNFRFMPEWLVAAECYEELSGRLALQAGPLIYCLRESELGVSPQHFAAAAAQELEFDEDGTLWVDGVKDAPIPEEWTPFPPYDGGEEAVAVQLTPFYRWGSEGKQQMQVWLRKV